MLLNNSVPLKKEKVVTPKRLNSPSISNVDKSNYERSNNDKSNKETTILTEGISEDESGKSESSCEKAVSFLRNSTEIGNDSELELDVQRPIDKNDVD